MHIHGNIAPSRCRDSEEGGEGGKVLQSRHTGCRSGDKRQQSICSLFTIHVRGRVNYGNEGAEREAARGGEGPTDLLNVARGL